MQEYVCVSHLRLLKSQNNVYQTTMKAFILDDTLASSLRA